MKKILHIISSPRTSSSLSRRLGSIVVEKITEKYPDSGIKVRDLVQLPFPHLTEGHIDAFFTPEENRSPSQQSDAHLSDELVSELKESDIIVVEAPMYNFTITSTLKAYFDHIARAGKTFRYTGHGHLPQGLLKDKEAYVIVSSGGIYSKGNLKKYNYLESYVAFFLSLIGIRVVNVFRAEGQAILGPDKALERGIASIRID